MRRFKIPLGVTIFAAIWLLVLLVPPLRESFGVWRAVQNQFFLHRAGAEEWEARFPNDPRLEAAALRDNFVSSESEAAKRVLLQFDALSRRFPRENWIRADRLRASTSKAMRMETEMSASPPPNGASRSTYQWLSDAAIRLALAHAVEGRKREPDNAFFPWMEAVFHFALRENDAALAALARAGKCPRWNDYATDEARRRLAIYSLEKDLLWEEKVALGSAQLFSHLAPMREASRAATWQGIKAMRRGDHHRALQIFEAVMSASRPLQASGGSFIVVLVGESLERSLWKRVAKESGVPLPKVQTGLPLRSQPQYHLQLAQTFATYARRHGREDVAAQALAGARQSDATLLSSLIGTDEKGGFAASLAASMGVSERTFRIAVQGAGLGAKIGFCALIAATIWIAGALWGRFFVNREAPTRGQIARCASFSFWASAIYFAVLPSLGANDELGIWDPWSSQSNVSWAASKGFFIWFVVFLWLAPVALTTWQRGRGRRNFAAAPSEPRNLRLLATRAALWGAAGTLLFCIFLDTVSQPPLLQGTGLEWPFSGIVLVVALSAALGFEWQRARPRNQGAPMRGAAPVLVAPRVENWLFAARLARRSAGALAVAGSVLYLVVAISIWPPRARLNAVFEHRLQVGEVAAMREQLALQRQTTRG
ncbi:MAG: hypothetical protein KY445_11850 [Armatimonadetes bacterium]|nr:hypothetical protein [Armatimonadota bacterium]